MRWGPSPFGWLPEGLNEETGFRLDIVSLLAVIGEYAMAEQAQPLTASWLCVLPRLLPAPQVLLKPSRPFRMPDHKAKVVGVKGGTIMETLNYFPNILHPIDKLKPLDFQVYSITHRGLSCIGKGPGMHTSHHGLRSISKKNAWNHAMNQYVERNGDIEMGQDTAVGPIRRTTMQRDKQPARLATNAGTTIEKPLVPVDRWSPLKILDVVSFILTLAILFLCIWNRDGIACMALGILSVISSIVGYASKWRPSLMNRSSLAQTPRGDVMVRTREGGFILVLCEEAVARELYFGNEQCDYKLGSTIFYRVLVGTATFLLMSSVVLLGNCKFIQQAAIGTGYIVLNFAYWMVSLVPKKRLWDLSRYECVDLGHDEDLLEFKRIQETQNDKATYTRTLWYAIYASEETEWCHRSDAIPKTDAWAQWLKEADVHTKADNKNWDPVQALNDLLKGPAQSAPKLQYRQTLRTMESMQNQTDLERLESQLQKQLQEVKALRRRIGGSISDTEDTHLD